MQKWLRFFPWLQRGPASQGDTADAAPVKPEAPAAPEKHTSPVAEAAFPAEAEPSTAQAGDTAPTAPAKPVAPAPSGAPVDYAPPAALFRPCRPDRGSCSTPRVDAQLLRRSLALSHMTYTLDIVPWLEAGWRDFSFQIDDVLESGAARISTAADSSFLRLANLERMQRARTALAAKNPLVQLLAALRQRERSDTVKAVCMMYPLSRGRHLLAIGFMGTGKRFYDWFSNLRMGQEDGFHQGFLQLCDRFDAAAEEIAFPETALALGLERLTLKDVLAELRRPDSRFRLWMAGHSQGGAVMQLYTHRLMHRYGVLPMHLCGISFAAPTVAAAGRVERPWAYPLWHVRNRDDVVCRVGAAVHLGRLLDFAPDAAFRAASYQYSALPADAACRAWLLPVLADMRDNPSTLQQLTALLLCVAQEKGEDALGGFAEKYGSVPAVDRLLALADDHAQGLLRQLAARQRRTYREQTGQDMDEACLAQQIEALRPYVQATPLRRILSVMGNCLLQPHQLHGDREAPGAYSMIVEAPPYRLMPLRWEQRAGQAVRVRQPEPGRYSRRFAARRGKARLRVQR